MAKRKGTFNGVKLMLPVEDSRVRASEFHINTFTGKEEFDYDYINDIKEGKRTREEVILKVVKITKEDDMIAYKTFDDVIEYLLGRFGKQDLKEQVIFKKPIDIVKLFDTDKKFDAFLAFIMKYSIENKENGVIPFQEIQSSFNVDTSYLLFMIEEMMVELYDSERKDARKYLYKFLSYYNAYFLNIAIFKLNYMVISMKLKDLTYISKKGKEIVKSSVSAIYLTPDGRHLFFRQLQFSQKLLEQRIRISEENDMRSPLNWRLYSQFLNRLGEDNLEQIAYAKDADTIKNDGQVELELFFKYKDSI